MKTSLLVRTLSLLLIATLFTICFASCGENAKETEKETSEETVPQSETEPATETEPVSETEPLSETESETEPLPPEEPGTVVFFGTPILDGELDDLYLCSFKYEEKPLEHMNYSASSNLVEQYMANTSGIAYYLYDDNYLYICAVIHDETICSRGEEWRFATEWPWNDDGAELYLWFEGQEKGPDGEEIGLSIHADAAGLRAVVDEEIWGDNHESAKKYRDLDEDDWCTFIDEENNNYVVELRYALPEGIGEGSMIGTLLEIDDRWAVSGENYEKLVGALFVMPRDPSAENLQVKLGYTYAEDMSEN